MLYVDAARVGQRGSSNIRTIKTVSYDPITLLHIPFQPTPTLGPHEWLRRASPPGTCCCGWSSPGRDRSLGNCGPRRTRSSPFLWSSTRMAQNRKLVVAIVWNFDLEQPRIRCQELFHI